MSHKIIILIITIDLLVQHQDLHRKWVHLKETNPSLQLMSIDLRVDHHLHNGCNQTPDYKMVQP